MFNEVKWKMIKDMITLAKNWTEVFKSLIKWYRSIQKEKKLYKELEEYQDYIVGPNQGPAFMVFFTVQQAQEMGEKITKLVRSLIKQRQKRRNASVTVI